MLRHRPGPRFRITKLYVKNFRSIQDVNLDIGELTLLVGPNASGKSNLMDALRFVSDAFRWDLERAISYRNGISAISRRRTDTDQLDFEIGICAESRGYRMDYKFHIIGKDDGSFSVAEESCKADAADGSIEPIDFCIKEGSIKSPERLFSEFPHVDANNLYLLYVARRLRFISREVPEDANSLSRELYGFGRRLNGMRFYHIFPEAFRDPQRVSNPNPLQEDGSNIASILRDIHDNRPKDMDRLKESLGVMVKGITDLRIQLAGAYLITELAHSDSSDNGVVRWFDLSQESDGTLRLLAMLVALNQRPPIPLIGIEEPELAVHPGAMEALAEDLMEAARRSQILLTTHSPHLIDQFPIENIRAVQMVDGVTQAGNVSQYQREVVSQHLFSAGELHQSEGLRMFFD